MFNRQTQKYPKEDKSTQYQFCDPSNCKDIKYDRQRLALFLRKSCKVMEGLISYRNGDKTIQELLSTNNENKFLSDGISFVYNGLLNNRFINDISFSLNNCNIIAVAYSKLNKDLDDEKQPQQSDKNKANNVQYNGLICIWDITQPSYPIKLNYLCVYCFVDL